MLASEVARAVPAAKAIASSLGLAADDAIVLQNSNKLTLRLLPGDVLARVAPETDHVARFEIELARRLTEAGCPVAALDPRVAPDVHERDGFAVTLWTHYASVAPGEIGDAEYAVALKKLHTGMRQLDVPAPHFTERVAQARGLVADRDRTPALGDADRRLLADTLDERCRAITGRGGPEQLLHGEPHPGNLLATRHGPLFIDLETVCRGPVEFDLAHAPDAVAAHCSGIDPDLLHDCRILVLAIITTWRWDRDDQLPDGHRLGREWLDRIRAEGPSA
ncbi:MULTISPECIES: aminoglycoside phosphotransferase family protein [unclassified Streptomyces]|uniref:phosphotransferase n=1 Tax=unclassified Streptomyces TaxID=2593676 RepID=UPI000DBA2FF6|nr:MULTISPECIES: aminoglycoside phosphotransferase family protein [unclassified Streptomyces]MYT75517.1 phosphotransferase [Streptomyces sp. SID8367]RAJ86923.1 phosphotransferase family enzyme [Streptomyces sp. PsTaAH-137]